MGAGEGDYYTYDYDDGSADGRRFYHILNPRWVAYFCNEYWSHYKYGLPQHQREWGEMQTNRITTPHTKSAKWIIACWRALSQAELKWVL